MDLHSHFKGEMNLKTTFAVLDKNGDGKITAKELKEVLGNNPAFKGQPSSFWDDLISEVDLNGDGEVGQWIITARLRGIRDHDGRKKTNKLIWV